MDKVLRTWSSRGGDWRKILQHLAMDQEVLSGGSTLEMHWAEELTIEELALARLCEFAQEGLDDMPVPLI